MPFRIKVIRSDNWHEFPKYFCWHLRDLGIEHIYIKLRTPRLNGRIERSHIIDDQEFFRLLANKDDVDIENMLSPWESFCDFQRPRGVHQGKTPYESPREKLAS